MIMDLTVKNIIKVLKEKDYAVFEEDSKKFNLNIVGIRTNDQQSNRFNDGMVIFWRYLGRWNSIGFPITTDPGTYWRKNPMNVKGTAILKEGQHKGMWKVGKHKGYPALQQNKPCTVIRDNNEDNILDFNGEEDFGHFGINQHKAGHNSTQVDKWSAGCQVWANADDFAAFMAIVEKSAETYGPQFTYTLIDEPQD